MAGAYRRSARREQGLRVMYLVGSQSKENRRAGALGCIHQMADHIWARNWGTYQNGVENRPSVA
jgi:hypothetical protein